MIKKNIYYNNLLTLLTVILNSPETTDYYDRLTDPKEQDDFIHLIFEKIDFEIKEINSALASEIHYGNSSSLIVLLETLEPKFQNFIIPRKKEILLILNIIEHISNQIPDLTDSNPLSVSDFELVSMDTVMPDVQFSYYHYLNTIDFKDSLFFLSLSGLSDFKKNLQEKKPDLNLLFTLLSKIGVDSKPLTNNYYILVKNGQSTDLVRIKSALLLHIVSEGYSFHKPIMYNSPTNNKWQSKIKIENKYQQFFETINILSEYNFNKDVISKYLHLYQVFEDFMYKTGLVKLERKNNGRFFSIRDFKRMYETVSDKEHEALLNFVKEIFPLTYSPGITFKKYILDKFRQLSPSTLSEQKINDILVLFGIGANKYNQVNDDTIPKVYSQLIYHIRNSIVHNKTTEFHLTYASLNDDIHKFLETFLMPTIEACIFYLTADATNTLVRFDNSKLEIWADS